jgi:archaellum component FlaC
MKINFTEQEKKDIRDIIDEYRNVSGELYSFQKKADEIQEKVIELENNLKNIKEKEDKMMSELHSKYGPFSLQDIYDTII